MILDWRELHEGGSRVTRHTRATINASRAPPESPSQTLRSSNKDSLLQKPWNQLAAKR